MEENNCTFCAEFRDSDSCEFRSYITNEELNSRIIFTSTNFVALAGLGAIRDGYILMLPKDHLLSFAYLEPTLATEALEFKEKLTRTISHFFSSPIIFEHGDIVKLNGNSGSCIDHAHFHFYPSRVDLFPILAKKFEYRRIEHVTDLSLFRLQRQPYIYYEKNGISHAFLINEKLPSQYMRRVLMAEEGIPDEWDWSVFVGKANVINTAKKINGYIK